MENIIPVNSQSYFYIFIIKLRDFQVSVTIRKFPPRKMDGSYGEREATRRDLTPKIKK